MHETNETNEDGAVRVLLIDDHAAFRQPLGFLLGRESAVDVFGQAGSVAEAFGYLNRAELVVVDFHLPDGDAVDVLEKLRSANPGAVAVVLTSSADPRDHARVLAAGAVAVLDKLTPIDELIRALRGVAAEGNAATGGGVVPSPREPVR
jgi:DNA-binding NarL/FixJ family response regulator